MAKGVLLYRKDSKYKDEPWSFYRFPKKDYQSRALQMVGDWVIFLEPVKAGPSGYHAVGRIESIVPDLADPKMNLAMIDPTSYLKFEQQVPFSRNKIYPERSVLNEAGAVSGRAQSAVRVIPAADFNRIFDLGFEADLQLPRTDSRDSLASFAEEQIPYAFEQDRVQVLTLRTVRDRVFRHHVLKAYDRRCAFTGFQFINGGGRAEVEAAHIKSGEAKGPDVVQNGLALSGTVHWMFDRGLLSVADDSAILLSNHINDVDGVRKILNADGYARLPGDAASRPDPGFVRWHRETVFKGAALG